MSFGFMARIHSHVATSSCPRRRSRARAGAPRAVREAGRHRRARLGELGQLDQVLGLAAELCKLEAHHLEILDAEGAWARQCAADDVRRVRKRRGREVDVARRELRDGRVPPRGLVGLAALEQQDAAVDGEVTARARTIGAESWCVAGRNNAAGGSTPWPWPGSAPVQPSKAHATTPRVSSPFIMHWSCGLTPPRAV